VKKNARGPILEPVAVCKKEAAKSNPCNLSDSSQQSKKRRKVVPSLPSLKRIARLSTTDRNALIRSLKSSKKRKATLNTSKSSSGKQKRVSLSVGSGPSVNSNDWKNWVSVHGDVKGVEADIVDVGEVLGIKCKNNFQVLPRGSGKRGAVENGVVRKVEARKGKNIES